MAKILICDDHQDILDLLTGQLESAGHECTCATQGLEGFKENLQGDYDLIITDVMMPGWTGYDLVGGLEFTKGNMKIIVITGYEGDELITKLRKNKNVVEIMAKPWDRQKLLDAIEKHT